jgi:hypothetical protein
VDVSGNFMFNEKLTVVNVSMDDAALSAMVGFSSFRWNVYWLWI